MARSTKKIPEKSSKSEQTRKSVAAPTDLAKRHDQEQPLSVFGARCARSHALDASPKIFYTKQNASPWDEPGALGRLIVCFVDMW